MTHFNKHRGDSFTHENVSGTGPGNAHTHTLSLQAQSTLWKYKTFVAFPQSAFNSFLDAVTQLLTSTPPPQSEKTWTPSGKTCHWPLWTAGVSSELLRTDQERGASGGRGRGGGDFICKAGCLRPSAPVPQREARGHESVLGHNWHRF